MSIDIFVDEGMSVTAWPDPNREGYVENGEDAVQPRSAWMVRITTVGIALSTIAPSSVAMSFEELVSIAARTLAKDWTAYGVHPETSVIAAIEASKP